MKLIKLLASLMLLVSSSLFAATEKPNILVVWGDVYSGDSIPI